MDTHKYPTNKRLNNKVVTTCQYPVKLNLTNPKIIGSLAVLGNLIYDPETISNIISEETMNQPSIIEYWGEQARQQSTRENILEAIELRLQADASQTFKPALEAIDDLQRLKQLHRAAILAENVEDFRQTLEANGD